MPRRHDFGRSYWANLAGSLTVLSLRYTSSIDQAATPALSQLTRLRKLTLGGFIYHTSDVAAEGHIELSLPQLEFLTIAQFLRVSVSLSCPLLQSLELKRLHPLESLKGIPKGITKVWLEDLERASLYLRDMFDGQRLEHVTSLRVLLGPGSYEDPADLAFIRQVFRGLRIEMLCTDCPLENLTS